MLYLKVSMQVGYTPNRASRHIVTKNYTLLTIRHYNLFQYRKICWIAYKYSDTHLLLEFQTQSGTGHFRIYIHNSDY